jgi:FkbM family methyltransferase
MTAYDIGANIGWFTFLFARLVGDNGCVYAFEPEPVNHRCLARSLAINKCRNVILDTRAVADTEGVCEFDRRGGAFSGRLIGTNTTYKKTGNIRMVATASIDYLIRAESYRVPDIIKIDVEGNEGLVVAGMENTLACHAPIILCEMHTHLGDSAYTVLSVLAGHGYKLTDAFTGNPIPLAENECAKLSTYVLAVKGLTE